MLHWQWQQAFLGPVSPAALLRRLGGRVLDVLLPPRCLLCRAPTAQPHQLCGGCWGGLRLIEEPACPTTGLPLMGQRAAIDQYLLMHRHARREPWRALLAASLHDNAARALVHRLKFHDDEAPARFMARLMFRRVHGHVPRNALIVPVPLHRRRLWARRFNQSMLLARHLARLSGLELAPELLRRVRYTTPQTQLSGQQRRYNLHHAFAVDSARGQMLQGRAVLLVDDVLTTGATARACARELLAAGAREVHVAVFALASQRDALHI